MKSYPTQFFHCQVRVTTGTKGETGGFMTDMSFDEVHNRIIKNWKQEKQFTIGGVFVREHS